MRTETQLASACSSALQGSPCLHCWRVRMLHSLRRQHISCGVGTRNAIAGVARHTVRQGVSTRSAMAGVARRR
eukprot:3349117-Alexandrium_andersonii.AAC.1